MSSPISARTRTYRIALDAMLVAIYVTLSMVPSEISWASLPVLLCAFLLGCTDTIVITLCGSFIEQMWYGLNVTSIIWMLPWAIFAVFVGLSAKLTNKKPKLWKIILTVTCAEILLNVGNTTALLYFGYVSINPASFTSGLPLWLVVVLTYIVRMPHAIIRAVLSSVVIPLLLPPLRKAMARIHVF